MKRKKQGNALVLVNSPLSGRLVRIGTTDGKNPPFTWSEALRILDEYGASPLSIQDAMDSNYCIDSLRSYNSQFFLETIYSAKPVNPTYWPNSYNVGSHSSIFARFGSPITRHGFIAVKGKNPLIVVDSPLLEPQLAKKASAAIASGTVEFVTANTRMYDCYRKIAEDEARNGIEPSKRKAFVMKSRGGYTNDAWDLCGYDCGLILHESDEVCHGLFPKREKNNPGEKAWEAVLIFPSPEYVDKTAKSGTLLTQMGFDDRENHPFIDCAPHLYRGVIPSEYTKLLYVYFLYGLVPPSPAFQQSHAILTGVKEGKKGVSELKTALGFLRGKCPAADYNTIEEVFHGSRGSKDLSEVINNLIHKTLI